MSRERKVKKYDVALATLYFRLNYGSILNSYALYKTIEDCGLKPVLISRPPRLWTDDYSNPHSIANLFILRNCATIDFRYEDTIELNDMADIFLVGSDVLWDYNTVGKDAGFCFFLDYTERGKKKIAYGSSFGVNFIAMAGVVNEQARLLKGFDGIASREYKDIEILRNNFGIDSELVIDPVFICDRRHYEKCAENSNAKNVEGGGTFIFSSIENCNPRIRKFLVRGNEILVRNIDSSLRNFVDIDNFFDSQAKLGLDTSFHIRVDDYLYYIINSEFVITDNYCAVCMAIIFEKPFVVILNADSSELGRFKILLEPLGLMDRIVVLQSDLKKREYLFRKPIKWQQVNKQLQNLRASSEAWLKNQLGINISSVEEEETA